MKIVNLTEKYEGNYFVCLEDWSDEIREEGSVSKGVLDGLCERKTTDRKDGF